MKAKQRPLVHELKCAPPGFVEVAKGRKHVELRVDDRDYQVRDLLLLREYEDGEYTGRHCLARVTHLIRHGDPFGELLAPGVVAMSIRPYREPRSI